MTSTTKPIEVYGFTLVFGERRVPADGLLVAKNTDEGPIFIAGVDVKQARAKGLGTLTSQMSVQIELDHFGEGLTLTCKATSVRQGSTRAVLTNHPGQSSELPELVVQGVVEGYLKTEQA